MATTTYLTTNPDTTSTTDASACRTRRILRVDGLAGVAVGALVLAAAPTLATDLDVGTAAVRLAGGALVLLGVDALVVARLGARRLVTATRAFAIGRELLVALALVAVLVEGAPAAAVAAMALLLVDVALFGGLELASTRADRRRAAPAPR